MAIYCNDDHRLVDLDKYTLGKTEFWTVLCGDMVCTKHKSLESARRSARECERGGGDTHAIYCVREVRKRER